MTMTDTEAKALALELLNTVRDSRGLPAATMEDADGTSWFEALCRAIEREASIKALCRVIEREAATEARHAAELREQAERFREAVDAYGRLWSKRTPSRDEYNTHFAPFILPAPDPLAEAIRSALPKALVAHDTYDAIVLDVAAAVRKIREAGE